MANITETATYEPDIYEFAVTDDVLGGPAGVSNRQAQQLANRTKWLRENFADLVTIVAAFRTVGSVECLTSSAFVSTDYDADGLGVVGTPAEGWALLDGQGGREDWRGRTPVNFDPNTPGYNTPGLTGGRNSVTLDISNMPSHTHTATVRQVGNDASTLYGVFAGQQNGAGNQSRTATTDARGSGAPFDARPPFIVAVFRVWLG